jgi:tRNA G18 (ribose-2'-O)-methylase SpoU
MQAPSVQQLRGIEAISTALDAGRRLGLLLVQQDAEEPALAALVERARAQGVPIRIASASVLRRMTSVSARAPVLALEGRDPAAPLDGVLALGGALWLLLGIAYPTNAGVAIRTAEGSGASGVVVDAAWDHAGKRAALRASMRADWYMPVFWEPAAATIACARAHGHRILALENTGKRAPWEVDLRAPTLFIVGGESRGIPADVLAECDDVVRIPMAGFIPSYNLQIALGVVATERLRQLASTPDPA